MKVTIPVIFCRDGTVATGWFSRERDGKCEHSYDVALDCLDEKAYASGYVIVHIEAEVDMDELQKRLVAKGQVKEVA